MTIKQIVNDLLNKKWSLEDLFWLILMCVTFSTFTTPFLGIPIGIIVYFLLFNISDETKEESKKYDLKKKK
ncbi:VraH family protein [Staphylococcus haemolyticus]|uniref:VraH family peptide resistance protein n=1 Tax=Staphylococcus TaxID=1279 RepID=UPI001E539B2C|nr:MULTISPECIES: VraH family protein [Staphylococcus]MCD9056037.1 VraH family protein [Staphylococcus arlettae]MCH4484555.1 VraH family protein [Staphylococcus haemolyticus]